jgi:2,3-bisphosphoglycerate-dependent phosphoglycerate mutase
VASGWNDIPLSESGVAQAKELGRRRPLDRFEAVFTSDLARAYQTAQLAFKGIAPGRLHVDWRLRECGYGEMTQRPKEEVNSQKLTRVTAPFPGGESYEQTNARMRSFLEDLLRFHGGQTVLVIGHRATQYGLELLINHVPLTVTVATAWRWQPGWSYELRSL